MPPRLPSSSLCSYPNDQAPRVARRPGALGVVALLAAVLFGCGGPEADWGVPAELGELDQALTNGAPHGGHPAVGLLTVTFRDGRREKCTGSLVGAHTVLTAAHCVVDATTLSFELGAPAGTALHTSTDQAAGPRLRYAVQHVKVHPDYRADQPASFDLALLWLPQAPNVAPLALGTRAPTVGQPVTLVGYGQTAGATGDAGIKRIASNAIAAVEPTLVAIVGSGSGSGNFCLGDSGGPVLATVQGQERVVAVNSHLVKATGGDLCNDDGRAVRVDGQIRWLSEAAAGDLALPADGLTGDALPPEVTILTPAPGVAVGDRLVVRARVRDNVAVREAVLLVNGLVAARATQAPYDFPVTLSPGLHALVVVAEDAVGNRAQASVTVEGGPAGQAGEAAGCSLGGTPASGLGLPGLLGLLLVLRRRRRGTAGNQGTARALRESGCLGGRQA